MKELWKDTGIKYWMVHNHTKGAPNLAHECKEDAIDEATRLCRKENRPFAVLETVLFVKPSETPVELVEPIEPLKPGEVIKC